MNRDTWLRLIGRFGTFTNWISWSLSQTCFHMHMQIVSSFWKLPATVSPMQRHCSPCNFAVQNEVGHTLFHNLSTPFTFWSLYSTFSDCGLANKLQKFTEPSMVSLSLFTLNEAKPTQKSLKKTILVEN